MLRNKDKKNKPKFEPKDEFRFNNDTCHPNYVFGKSGNRYKSMGLTHKEYTFGRRNMPLDKNPDKTDKDKAYIRNGIISSKVQNYGNKTLNNFEFSKEDKAKVKSKRRNYQKRLKRHKKTSKQHK